MKDRRDNYSALRIPRELAIEVDKLKGTLGYTSRADIVKDAIRDFLAKNTPQTPRQEG